MYGDGRGVNQDWLTAYPWIDRAAKQGLAQAIKDKDYVLAHMSAEQRTEAEKLATE